MKCIGGGGVWCSRTYAYSSSSATLQGQLASTAAPFGMDAYGNGKLTAADSSSTPPVPMTILLTGAGAGLDGGSCCGVSQTTFNTAAGIGIIGAVTTTFVTTSV